VTLSLGDESVASDVTSASMDALSSAGGDERDGSHDEEDEDESMAALLWSLATVVAMAMAAIIFEVGQT
jgi:hypothetical protein